MAKKETAAKTKKTITKSQQRGIDATPATEPSLVYYGPHPCSDTKPDGRKEGNTGCDARIVKAGNGAPAHLEFDYPSEGWAYPNTIFTPHVCADHK